MRLFLAPMEGVVDHHFRELVTPIAGVDACVTEFVRVVDRRLPPRVFHRMCPELLNNSRTLSGTPVRLQLLGGEPDALAANAEVAAELGAAGIDINFGCPSKCVNGNDGGSVLLRDPKRLEAIVSAVRKAVPAHVPVSAKIRLGFDQREGYLDNARAIENAGATELFVHARSKVDGYRPPAYWRCIGEIRESVKLPVIANGEIWSVDDWHRCREQSGVEDFMLGRGLVSMPDLAAQIRAAHTGHDHTPLSWPEILDRVYRLYTLSRDLYGSRHLGNRVKQWLGYLQRNYVGAETLFRQIRRCKQAEEFDTVFRQALEQASQSTDMMRDRGPQASAA